jgi:methylenetetrahydrofolate--tRNA-(uracil-5-)-methyltransferase
VRLGSLHRNTFVDSPSILMPTLQLQMARNTFLAGQIIGVEGYVESAAAGLLAGINAARLLAGEPLVTPPATTALGSLLAYVTQRGRREFQPMNANYGVSAVELARAREVRRAGARRLRSLGGAGLDDGSGRGGEAA